MPDRRNHGGAHPEDGELFSDSAVSDLKSGVHDLRWLFDRGYAVVSSVKLVGDRYGLNVRQRIFWTSVPVGPTWHWQLSRSTFLMRGVLIYREILSPPSIQCVAERHHPQRPEGEYW